MRPHSRNANHMVAATDPPIAAARRLAGYLAPAAFGALVLPAIATLGAPVHAPIWQAPIASSIAAVIAVGSLRWARPGYLQLVGVAIISTSSWLLAQASYPVAAWLVAPALGLGLSLASGWTEFEGALRRRDLFAGASLVLVAIVIVAARIAFGRDAAMAAGAGVVAVAAFVSALGSERSSRRRNARAIAVAASLLMLGTAGYIGATTPSATWFGSLEHNGPRSSNQVAVTFDDGPNPPYSLEISAILDRHGVKGTFFTVGKALEARPDVSKALMDDGHLLGNHSYHHDAFSWLDPRYEELDETQDAFKRTLGVCPALFRPPHGSHTPFMAHAVSSRGMTMVTWDVSAGDWATDDGEVIAKRILDKVKGGSIILLHDGIDGNIGADRSVILAALPIILDGLQKRGLQAVTLDKLLGVSGYLEGC